MSGFPHISSGYGSGSDFFATASNEQARGPGSGRHQRSRGADGSNRTNSAAPSSVSRSDTRTDSNAASLKLTLQTAEGDTVELSVEAQSVHQSSNALSRDSRGATLQHTESQGDALQASIKVTGNLSDTELSDIKSLLSSLATDGTADPAPSNSTTSSSATPAASDTASDSTQPSTIAAYSFSLTRVHQVTQSSVYAYA